MEVCGWGQPERKKSGSRWGQPEIKKSGSWWEDRFMYCTTREKEEWKWVEGQVHVLYKKRDRSVEVGGGTGNVPPERNKTGSG